MNQRSGIFSTYLSDPEMELLVSDEAFITKMLYFETALAKAQAELEIIPKQCAEEIGDVLNRVVINPADLTEGTLQNGIPVVTLLSLLKKQLTTETQTYLHYGATSQDVMDTATILIIKEALSLLEKRIGSLIRQLNHLSEQYGQTSCMARTRGQLAMPVTFNIKLAAWLQPLNRQLQRLEEFSERLLKLQLGGAVGDRAAYKHKGDEVVNMLAAELGLSSGASWHTQRDTLCEFTNWLAITTAILGKMGGDILIMAQSEIEELKEQTEGGGKSSAMMHKNNPVLSEALVALARLNAGLQEQQLLSMIHVAERDATAWILEWQAVPQMLLYTGTALNHALIITSKMEVNTANMKRNIEQFKHKAQNE